jgi:CBS domain-containing protein
VWGRIADVYVQTVLPAGGDPESARPKISGLVLKTGNKTRHIKFTNLQIVKFEGRYKAQCTAIHDVSPDVFSDGMLLGESILDKQIVDINGRKLVRVNDIRLVAVSDGAYAIAVDVGVEGLLRRIGIYKPVKIIASLLQTRIPSKFIIWDDVETIDSTNFSIKLSKSSSKLHTLHPSDLADIIEELGKVSQTSVFSSLDEEKAADVLEELESTEQIHIIESLPLEKAADVLEKMPADEAAYIIDQLEEEKAEELLNEMETESSEDVRELLEYPDDTVGSLMATDILSFSQETTINDVLSQIRQQQPEMEMLYNIFVTDQQEHLIATLSLRDLVISDPKTVLKEIMIKNPVHVTDQDRIDSLAEIVSKYNLLAVPVTDEEEKLVGMVVIDDIVEDLIGKRRTN